jgi:hypothetical protein
VSIAEDVASATMSVTAVLWPLLIAVLAGVLLLVLLWWWARPAPDTGSA